MQEVIKKNLSEYNLVISNFEGPLDLLVYLISKNKMTIFDISLSELTDKYIEYLNQMAKLDLEITSEFIVMASTLLDIKARKLLPEIEEKVDDEETLTEEELLSRIIEYKRYKEVSEKIYIMYKENFGMFSKEPEKIKYKRIMEYTGEMINIQKLEELYKEVIERQENKMNLKANEIKEIAVHEKVSVKDKVKQIVNYLKSNKKMVFNKMFNIKSCTNVEIVTAFLGLLELTKLKKVSVEQEELFSDILVEKAKEIS